MSDDELEDENRALCAARKSLLALNDASGGYIALCNPSAGTHAAKAIKSLVAQGFLEPLDVGVYRITPSGKRRAALSGRRKEQAARLRRLHRVLTGA